MMNKNYTISIPVQIDFVGNDMSPQNTTININVSALNTTEALKKISIVLEKLVKERLGGEF